MSIGFTTLQKALKINLDDTIYGTFAEIGAGQDVAGNFFKAGAASGTVAKSISAYDMIFSDKIYGKEKSNRYVCQSRLEKMLKYEYDLVLERLQDIRSETKFFSFANTVSARNFHGTNDPHGWLGIRFRDDSSGKFSQLIVHVRMHDNTNLLQQKAIGVLGVNMIYASYYHSGNLEEFVDLLMENLSSDQVEIDMIKVSGSAFKKFDNRLLNLQLLQKGITCAVLFNEDGEICLPKDELYRKNILITRGSYRPPTKVNIDVLRTGVENFKEDIGQDEQVISLAEITISNLSSGGGGEITHEDFLARVDLLSTIGQKVLITSFPQYFLLSNYMKQFKSSNLGIVLGAYNFAQIFDIEYHQSRGNSLEAFGLLFRENVKLYLYPYREESESDELINLATLTVKDGSKHLLEHVKGQGFVKDLRGFDNNLLHIYSRKVLKMIVAGEKGWEEYVPDEIVKTINEKCLFGHPCVI